MKSFFGLRCPNKGVDAGLLRWVRCLVLSPVLGLMMTNSAMAAETDAGIVNPAITEAELMAELLEDPQSLPLNFALLKRQMDAGQLRAAAVTIERLLLLDPNSKLTKILLAELRYKMGEVGVAEVLLSEVIADNTTSDAMRAQAEEILDLVIARRQTDPVRFTISSGYGRARNARSASKHDQILLADAPITNTTDDKSELFHDYRVAAEYLYELPYQQPQLLRLSGSIAVRDFVDYDAGDLTTMATELGYSNESGISAQGMATYTTREDKKYAGSFGAAASYRATLPTGGVATTTLTARKNLHFDTPSVTNHKLQNGHTLGVSAVATHPIGAVQLGVSIGASETDSKRRYLSSFNRQAEISVAATVQEWVVRAAAGQTRTRFGGPDLAISSIRRRDNSNNVSITFSSPVIAFANGAGLQFDASARQTRTRSNIANFSRKVSEARLGFSLRY